MKKKMKEGSKAEERLDSQQARIKTHKSKVRSAASKTFGLKYK